MVDVREKCTGCIHHATCKYCAVYENSIKDLTEDYADESPVVVAVTCKHFSSISVSPRVTAFAN